jgi:hypothetical protein
MTNTKNGHPTQQSDTARAARTRPVGHDPNRPVGRGNPPVSGQFKSGQSGNPRGRPKRAHTLGQLIDSALQAKVTISESGRARKVTALEAIVLKQRNAALGGDPKAIERILRLAQMAAGPKSAPGEADAGRRNNTNDDRKIISEFSRWLQECENEAASTAGDDDSGDRP